MTTTSAPPADWWHRICARLRELKQTPGHIDTSHNHARNDILEVNEKEGYVELLAERSRSGRPRRIYRWQMSPSDRGGSARANGAMVRRLWELLNDPIDEIRDDYNPHQDLENSLAREARPAYGPSLQPQGPGWTGPVQFGALLAQSLQEDAP